MTQSNSTFVGVQAIIGYILDKDKNAVAMYDMMEWAEWFEMATRKGKRIVGQTRFGERVFVSTLFLGVDYNHSRTGSPFLFETLIFGGKHDNLSKKYATWEEALEGHRNAVKYFTKLLVTLE